MTYAQLDRGRDICGRTYHAHRCHGLSRTWDLKNSSTFRIRKHPVSAELRSPKLNGRFHILDGVRCRKLVERVRYDVGFDPRIMSQWLLRDIFTLNLFANWKFWIRTGLISENVSPGWLIAATTKPESASTSARS